ncbi:hypothetical protein BDZ94DRAFT_862602 [Collybia nuda]|uniref:G domain-containing protein n=1 Tax=Collybia nuda TaxID=64659 RepID=A0A9P6CHI6_9AGAR|nr:hypothetical protein BDZ94DRAFT_862602 [Collybia nuda]
MAASPAAIKRREDPGAFKSLSKISRNTNEASGLTQAKISEICPQFRILVVGKCGSGKSSLVNSVFGITDATVSHIEPGVAEINHEISSSGGKPQFLLHDSLGFEYCEDNTVEIVQKFLRRRSQEPLIKDRVHAIWLCISIPIANGRLIETSVEEFLKQDVQKELEQIPIIVVLTKYDRLVAAERLAMKHNGQETSFELAEKRAQQRLQKECVKPLENLAGRGILYVAASTQYDNTLNELAGTTFSEAQECVAKAIIAG